MNYIPLLAVVGPKSLKSRLGLNALKPLSCYPLHQHYQQQGKRLVDQYQKSHGALSRIPQLQNSKQTGHNDGDQQ